MRNFSHWTCKRLRTEFIVCVCVGGGGGRERERNPKFGTKLGNALNRATSDFSYASHDNLWPNLKIADLN
jgi:hypothetical protein